MRFTVTAVLTLLLGIVPASAWAAPAIVYTGHFEDDAYNHSLHDGIVAFREKTNRECVEIESAADGSEYLRDVRRSIAQGHSPILFPYSAEFPEIIDIAHEHKETEFVFLDYGSDVDLPNAWSFLFADHEGAFMAGALAALMTDTKTVGFIYISDSYPVLLRFRTGYIQGVQAVDPGIRVLEGTLGDHPGVWHDVQKARDVAAGQIEQGADVLFSAAGFAGTGVLAQAAESGIYAIGVDSNQNSLHPGTMIGSMVKRSDKAITIALSLALSEVHRDGVKRLGLAQGAVAMDFDGVKAGLVPQSVKDRLELLKSEILLGKRRVRNYDE